MSADGFMNIGTDHSIVIVNKTTGATLSLDGRRTMFTSSAKDQVYTSTAVDNGGKVDHRVQPGGWTGSIECERNSASFSKFFASLEFQKLNANGTEVFCEITSYEYDADKQQLAVFRYTRVVFHGYDAGSWGREIVKPKVSFEAQERLDEGFV